MKNTIHCVKCGFGTDVNAETWGKQEYNPEGLIGIQRCNCPSMSLGGKDSDAPKFMGSDCTHFEERKSNE